MSLSIDSRCITGIYALGQWFKVKKDTVDVDAFEFINWEECSSRVAKYSDAYSDARHHAYQMGSVYKRLSADGQWVEPEHDGAKHPDCKGCWSNVTGYQGIAFIDADTGERVSFSLMEVRAFREDRK